jgi:hypothetical protein
MREKRRVYRATAEAPVAVEIAHLRGLDLQGLRARWQSVFQQPAPAHLGRHLLFSIVAYKIQADRFGDLDHETKKLLDRTDVDFGFNVGLESSLGIFSVSIGTGT